MRPGPYRSICQSMPYYQRKRSITVACPRTLYHSVTFQLDVLGNPQEPHPNVTCFLTVLDSPLLTVSPVWIAVLIQCDPSADERLQLVLWLPIYIYIYSHTRICICVCVWDSLRLWISFPVVCFALWFIWKSSTHSSYLLSWQLKLTSYTAKQTLDRCIVLISRRRRHLFKHLRWLVFPGNLLWLCKHSLRMQR